MRRRDRSGAPQRAAAARGNHEGRPKVIDDDTLTCARVLRDADVSIPNIAKQLTIKTGKNAGRNPSIAPLYRALAAETPVAIAAATRWATRAFRVRFVLPRKALVAYLNTGLCQYCTPRTTSDAAIWTIMIKDDKT